MSSHNVIFWEVDTQVDFMLPGGNLYVPGAEKIIPTLKRMVDAARQGRVLLVSDACQHTPDDPEFASFPPHCVRGTPGAQIVPEALADRYLTVPNDREFKLPPDVFLYQQIVIEKQTLDVFENPLADEIVNRLPKGAHYFVFGVVTEYCVRLAAKGLLERGRKVSLVQDAIETLKPEDGRSTCDELRSLGAGFADTDEALAALQFRQA
ncbi:MAG TPA: isochorismatase family protein [Candidatus Acidoferrales bacterium]|nr:isochorismatase family protein [Candidatus Acidoferrales bacterium]